MNGSTQKTVAFYSQGCKLNQYEIQALREGFLKHGYEEVPFSRSATYYILNTCTVTEQADKDAYGLIRDCLRHNPQGQIVVTGCLATAEPEKIKEMPGVTHVVDNLSKNKLMARVIGIEESTEEDSPFFKDGISYFEEKARAFVKVQDGCNYFCTFCKIPFVRGRLISRNETKVLDELKKLIEGGYQEIVLSGVCLGSYGKDIQGSSSLVELLERAVRLPGDFRLRLSSIDPRDTPVELAKLMASTNKLTPHLHLSLQSGDNEILKRMKRGYSCEDFLHLVEQIRQHVPDIGLTTDLIVGFPGEQEQHFQNTLEFLKKIRFHKVHVFPYSQRPQTAALKLSGQLDEITIKKRVERTKQELISVTEQYLDQFIGKKLRVLTEYQKKDGSFEGFAENYARCRIEADSCPERHLIDVLVHKRSGQKLLTTILRD